MSKGTTFDRICCIVGLAHSLWIAKHHEYLNSSLFSVVHPDLQTFCRPALHFGIHCAFWKSTLLKVPHATWKNIADFQVYQSPQLLFVFGEKSKIGSGERANLHWLSQVSLLLLAAWLLPTRLLCLASEAKWMKPASFSSPNMMGLGKGNGTLKKNNSWYLWMLDFWGVPPENLLSLLENRWKLFFLFNLYPFCQSLCVLDGWLGVYPKVTMRLQIIHRAISSKNFSFHIFQEFEARWNWIPFIPIVGLTSLLRKTSSRHMSLDIAAVWWEIVPFTQILKDSYSEGDDFFPSSGIFWL